MSKTTLVLIVGFIAGCGAAVVAPLIIPPAHAQTTQRWEVHCVIGSRRSMDGWASDMTSVGTRAGAQGWELVEVEGAGICFKRPAP